MITFDQWLETQGDYMQPRDEDERLRMSTAFSGALDDMSKLTLKLMQESMLRGMKAAGVEA